MTDITMNGIVGDLQEDIARYEEKLAAIKREIASERREGEIVEGHVNKCGERLAELSTDIYAMEERKKDFDSQFAIIETRKTVVKNEIDEMTIRKDALKSELDTGLATLKNENDKLIAESNEQVIIQQNNLIEVIADLEAQRSTLASVKAATEALRAESATLETTIADAKKEFTTIASSIESLKEDKATLAQKLEDEISVLTDKRNAVASDIADENKKLTEMKAEFEKVQRETFALGEVKVAMDKREAALDVREAKIVDLYAKAGVPLPA